MNQRDYFHKKRMHEQQIHETYTDQVKNYRQKEQAIQNTNKFDSSFARAQYKRNLDALRTRYLDHLFQRKQRLIDLQKNEERQLMQEFEEMKRQEKLTEFENQAYLVKNYKHEQEAQQRKIRDTADQIRIDGSNEVRKEKMALESVKTANYNKFSKAWIEHLKQEEESKEQRYQDFQYLQNQEKESLKEVSKELLVKEKHNDYKNQLNSQVIENKRIKEFNAAKEKRQQEELTKLEEQQIEMERKLEREKKNVTRNFLVRTLQENQAKIQAKKDDIRQAKQAEFERMKALEAELEAEQAQKKIDEAERKKATQVEMKKQLKLQEKMAEDTQALDRLAQAEQDKRNTEFDLKEARTHQVRKQQTTDMLLHNQEQLHHKGWQRDMDERVKVNEKVEVKTKINNWALEESKENIHEKQKKTTQMQELQSMMAAQAEDHEAKQEHALKMEKKLLQDANKFDNFVSDIIDKKRQFLDKLREQRPF